MASQLPYDEEKVASANHVDQARGNAKIHDVYADLSESSKERVDIAYDEDYTPEEGRKIKHRVDRRLISTCGILYCISLMDRTNLSAAAIAGMTVELKLNVGYRYSLITLVFFITYVLFQPPTTALIRRLGPRPMLSTIVVLWGAVMIVLRIIAASSGAIIIFEKKAHADIRIGFGFPKVWTSMIPLRLILGILEAGFFPGCVYLISTWYTRYEVHKRYSIFYLIGCLASACSGILAYGLMQLDGVSGYRGWRWIFILEGVITCVLGIVGYFALVDFPDRAHRTAWKFLNERECNYILRKIAKDRDDSHVESFNLKKWAASGLDWKIWMFAMIFFSLTTVTYAIAYFLPIILREEMGYSIAAAQCLVAPPYAFAGILMFSTAWVGDKYHFRGPVLIFNALIGIIGLCIMGFHHNQGVRYFGVFLTTAGSNANIPTCMAYQANNIRGQWKRAFCSATLVGFGGIGGIAGSLVFRSQDAPSYRPGIYAALACNSLIIVIVAILTVYFKSENKKVAQGKKILEGQEGFTYTL